MNQVLLHDAGVLVTLQSDGSVRKELLGENSSGLWEKVSPAEIVRREVRALQLLKDFPRESIAQGKISLDLWGNGFYNVRACFATDCCKIASQLTMEGYSSG